MIFSCHGICSSLFYRSFSFTGLVVIHHTSSVSSHCLTQAIDIILYIALEFGDKKDRLGSAARPITVFTLPKLVAKLGVTGRAVGLVQKMVLKGRVSRKVDTYSVSRPSRWADYNP